MTPAEFATRHVTRDEFVELVTSHRQLIRIPYDDEDLHELLDQETNERFRITEQELHPAD